MDFTDSLPSAFPTRQMLRLDLATPRGSDSIQPCAEMTYQINHPAANSLPDSGLSPFPFLRRKPHRPRLSPKFTGVCRKNESYASTEIKSWP
ncbi:unnamed protein product [Mycena citricolor]|uniref:Uncharacterized protein n=1 Tax=Mycena citricolor TaxID=2018698 RepID=A0AAD2HHR4_9AGAR|nr:unnamed protein product [Mycena citricolor]